MIQHRLATGRWVLVARGVYRLAGVPVTWKQRALAVLWGVSGFRPGPLEITVPAGRSGRNALAKVHRSTTDGVRVDGVAEGVAEMRVVRALLAAGLPAPARQYEIWVGGVLIARVDLAYPPFRLAMELDGFRWHAGRRRFRSDRMRRNRVEAAGWRMLEAAPEDIDDLVAGAAAIVPRAA